jgi:ribosomal protein S18 acetylase RimI-like enzyme
VVRIRPARASDVAVLEHMLVLAATWRAEAAPFPAREVLTDPLVARYVTHWPRSDDTGVIAEGASGRPVGAAWYRYFGVDEPGFGFVAPTTPELSIAVVPDLRGVGIGESLLQGLINVARSRGVRQLSLSVEPDNPAKRLYARMGFTPVGGGEGAVTMVLGLATE